MAQHDAEADISAALAASAFRDADEAEMPRLAKSSSQHNADTELSKVHAADDRSLPLLGVTIEALQRYAADERFDDETTTETACQHIFKADGMPQGWTGLARARHGESSHQYRNDATGAVQDGPPPGIRSIAEVLKDAEADAVKGMGKMARLKAKMGLCKGEVGKSNRFISQAWSLRFRRVVAAVARQVEKERAAGVTEEIYLWFDVISIDEHHAGDYAKGFSTMFMEAIKAIGHVYLAADPWDGPVVLTRIWCLWELFCCEQAGAKLSVCLSEADDDAFVAGLITDGVDAALIPFSKIDCKSAQATNKEDLEKFQGKSSEPSGSGWMRQWSGSCGSGFRRRWRRDWRRCALPERGTRQASCRCCVTCR